MLVDDELPVAARGTRGSEVLEIKREYGQALSLCHGHDRGVHVSEIEIREGAVYLFCTSQQRRTEVGNGVLTSSERGEERTGRVATDTGTQELIDLDDHGLGHDQLSSELGDQAPGETMRTIARVRRGDEWAGVSDDSQRAWTRSRR
jgi:hypothetical protein